MALTDSLKDDRGISDEYEDSPCNAKKFLDALYSGQKVVPQTDEEKMNLLSRVMDGAIIPDYFSTQEKRRIAYEFCYLTKVGLL